MEHGSVQMQMVESTVDQAEGKDCIEEAFDFLKKQRNLNQPILKSCPHHN